MDKEYARLQEKHQQLLAENQRLADMGETQLRGLFDLMPQLGWTAKRDGSIDFYNYGWYEYTGTTFEEMQGWGWKAVHDPQILPTVVERWQESLLHETPFEMEFPLRRRDGQFRWFLTRVRPIRDAQGSLLRWVGINTDIEEQRQARTRTQRDLDQFFEMSLDLLCIAGLDGFFKRLNPSWTAVFGWTDEELRARPWLDFVHPEDLEATRAAGGQLSDGRAVISFTNRYACKDGTYRWIEWRSAPDLSQGLVYAAARDITDRIEAAVASDKMQKRLIVAERMVSVGTLAAGVAHEINNPLSYVMANLDMVLEEVRALSGGSPSGRMKDLEEMVIDARVGAERVRKIVRGLKTFSRTDEERRSVLDLKPVMELAINMAFNEIRHRARLVKDYGETPLVEVDDACLGQVFLNLLVNAAQALPEGNADANEIRIVTATDSKGRALIEVRDTGAGIDPAVLDRIFEPFFTTKPAGVGTGLGLSICHNIVTGMDGEISVSSGPGQGTTFRVALPPARTQVLVAGATVPTASPGRRAALLVVDDEPAIGIALRRVLREHEVTVLSSVADALALLGTGKHFDVIFSDLMMPHLSGMDFYRELTRRAPDDAGRMVFVTGGAFTPAAKAFLEEVANERLEKPFQPQIVRDLVQRFLK